MGPGTWTETKGASHAVLTTYSLHCVQLMNGITLCLLATTATPLLPLLLPPSPPPLYSPNGWHLHCLVANFSTTKNVLVNTATFVLQILPGALLVFHS